MSHIDEEQLFDFIELIPEITLISDKELTIVGVNEKTLNFLGYDRNEFIGMQFGEMFPYEEREVKPFQLNRLIQEGEIYLQRRMVTKNGDIKLLEVKSKLIGDLIISILTPINLGEGVSNRIGIENRLKDRVKELECLYAVNQVLWSENTADTNFSDKMQRIIKYITMGWQYPEITHCRIIIDDDEYVNEEFIEGEWELQGNININDQIRGSITVFYSKEMPIMDQGPFLYEEEILLNSLCENVGRYLRNKELEKVMRKNREIIRQKDKISTIGQLAGGIAHEFNNIFAVIQGHAELIEMKFDYPDIKDLKNHLEYIISYSDKGVAMTSKLLGYVKKQIITPQLNNLNSKITNLLPILIQLLPEDIDLEIDLDPSIEMIKCDEHQLDQILLNLVTNAKDAIKESGTIRLTTKMIQRNGNDNSVLLKVEDDGEGIAEKDIPNIFNPFYTSKVYGTGLGLSIIYGIMESIEGSISVESEINRGTTFRLNFPSEPCNLEKQRSDQTIDQQKPLKLLVVEDNIGFLNYMTQLLQQLGHSVLPLKSATEVLKLSEKSINNIDLIITDIVLPKINGIEMGKKLEEKYPGRKILYMSAYTKDILSNHPQEFINNYFMKKPFTVEDLKQKINKIMKIA